MAALTTLAEAIKACTADVRAAKALQAQLTDLQTQMAALRQQEQSITDQLAAAEATLQSDLAQARALA